MRRSPHHAFTLVEILVAVAIVALLAAIAVPNLLAAQTRSKVSRVHADMAALRTALESFAVDNNRYPSAPNGIGFAGHLKDLTRPVSYLSNLPEDPFVKPLSYQYFAGGPLFSSFANAFGSYTLASPGPDRLLQTELTSTVLYDPTNGTISGGDIVSCHRTADAGTLAGLLAGAAADSAHAAAE